MFFNYYWDVDKYTLVNTSGHYCQLGISTCCCPQHTKKIEGWFPCGVFSIGQIYQNSLNLSIQEHGKFLEFFEKSLLSGAEKHTNLQVTLCVQNVTTNSKFDD